MSLFALIFVVSAWATSSPTPALELEAGLAPKRGQIGAQPADPKGPLKEPQLYQNPSVTGLPLKTKSKKPSPSRNATLPATATDTNLSSGQVDSKGDPAGAAETQNPSR